MAVVGRRSPRWICVSVSSAGDSRGIDRTFTQGTSSRYVSAAVAVRATANGTAPLPFSVRSLEHFNNPDVTSATLTYQCPTHGNLTVLDWTSDGGNWITSITESVPRYEHVLTDRRYVSSLTMLVCRHAITRTGFRPATTKLSQYIKLQGTVTATRYSVMTSLVQLVTG